MPNVFATTPSWIKWYRIKEVKIKDDREGTNNIPFFWVIQYSLSLSLKTSIVCICELGAAWIDGDPPPPTFFCLLIVGGLRYLTACLSARRLGESSGELRVYGWTDGRMGGWVDGRTDAYEVIYVTVGGAVRKFASDWKWHAGPSMSSKWLTAFIFKLY